jgi:Ca2+/Na+ antiporter
MGTLFCWMAWVFVVLKISPVDSGFVGVFSFYLSLFLAIIGTFSVLGFLVRSMILKNDDAVFKHVKNTFRQSIFVATVIVTMLLMLSQGWLYWWTATMLMMLFVFIEVFLFTSNKETPNNSFSGR